MKYKDENCLLLDTSNRWILCAVHNSKKNDNRDGLGQNKQASRTIQNSKTCFKLLAGIIQELCQEVDIKKPDWIVCTTGPGSFTGLRLGVAFARNLAQLWEIPVFGILSLQFYCYDILCKNKDFDNIAIMLDAKQRRIFASTSTRKENNNISLKTRSSIVDEPPLVFLKKLNKEKDAKAKYNIFADDPESIARYMPEESLSQYNIKDMPNPEPSNLYELASKLGGKKKATHWRELIPFYLRKDPAQATLEKAKLSE